MKNRSVDFGAGVGAGVAWTFGVAGAGFHQQLPGIGLPEKRHPDGVAAEAARRELPSRHEELRSHTC